MLLGSSGSGSLPSAPDSWTVWNVTDYKSTGPARAEKRARVAACNDFPPRILWDIGKVELSAYPLNTVS